MFNTFVVVVVALVLFGVLPGYSGGAPSELANVVVTNVDTDGGKTKTVTIVEPPVVAGPWQDAEAAFRAEQWADALGRYRHLMYEARGVPADEAVCRFFSIRVAECLGQLGRSEECRKMLTKAANSRWPVIRASANHKLAQLDERGGQHLLARMHAYRARAALGGLKTPLALDADCQYLIARVLSKKVRSYYQTEELVNWTPDVLRDPFMDRDEKQLRELLNEGVLRGERSTLSQNLLEIVKHPNSGRRWSVLCRGVSLEDLLNQFSGKTRSADIRWATPGAEVAKRLMNLRFRSVSAQEFNEIAAGSMGLVGRFTVDEVAVHDPQSYAKSERQRDLLAREAESVWRRFFLRHPQDPRVAEGHYALAALYAKGDQLDGAMREFQLVGQRFRDSEVAPQALMRCAQVKISLRDYVGARRDLADLLDKYLDHPLTDKVYLSMGEVSMAEALKPGLDDRRRRDLYRDAGNTFTKVFYLRLSRDSQIEACLGAGEAFAALGRHEDAAEWLRRYVGQTRGTPTRQDTGAYLLLGRSETALENFNLATRVLEVGMKGDLDDTQYVQLALELMRVHLARRDGVAALAVADSIAGKEMTEQLFCDRTVLMSRAYCIASLHGRAAAVIEQGLGRVKAPQLRAELNVALGRSYLMKGEPAKARKPLAANWTAMRPGRQQWLAGLELAQLCVGLHEPAQAIAVAQELQSDKCPADIRLKAKEVLMSAYVLQKDFANAAKAVPGPTVTLPGVSGS